MPEFIVSARLIGSREIRIQADNAEEAQQLGRKLFDGMSTTTHHWTELRGPRGLLQQVEDAVEIDNTAGVQVDEV